MKATSSKRLLNALVAFAAVAAFDRLVGPPGWLVVVASIVMSSVVMSLATAEVADRRRRRHGRLPGA